MALTRVQRIAAVAVSLSALVVLGLIVFRYGSHSEEPNIKSTFIPIEKAVALNEAGNNAATLEEYVDKADWTALVVFRPTDCYKCTKYINSIKTRMDNYVNRFAALAIDTNRGELKRFLNKQYTIKSTFIVPIKYNIDDFRENVDKIGNTPILTLLKGDKVRYAAKVTPSDKAMESVYESIFEITKSENE